jgi:outer membrane lipoprotein-sorting protein
MPFATAMTRALVPAAIIIPAAMLVAAPVLAQNAGSDMARLRTHISSVQSMTANFTQADPRGRSATGTMQLKRPGKVRFAYSGGDLLLVANGKTLTFIDYSVGQKSSWPLGRTPLGVLLSNSPDLKGRAKVVASDDPGVLTVEARDPTQYGALHLVFLRTASAPGGLQLYGWTAIDAQKKRTTVRLSNVRYNVAVSESAFTYAEPKKK